MDYWSREQKRALREKLDRRAAQLRGEIEDALRRADTEDALHLANHIEEIDDEAVADLETSLDVASLERDVRELRAVERAQSRFDAADFGLCADCGATIPFARLLAAPEAIRCTSCEAALEAVRGSASTKTL
jgi:DnaK suppressor protein